MSFSYPSNTRESRQGAGHSIHEPWRQIHEKTPPADLFCDSFSRLQPDILCQQTRARPARCSTRDCCPASSRCLPMHKLPLWQGRPEPKLTISRKTSPPTVQYRWKGGKDSVLTARFANDRMVDATVRVPNGKTFAIRSNGEIADMGQQE